MLFRLPNISLRKSKWNSQFTIDDITEAPVVDILLRALSFLCMYSYVSFGKKYVYIYIVVKKASAHRKESMSA
jgi:hypothetical protein